MALGGFEDHSVKCCTMFFVKWAFSPFDKNGWLNWEPVNWFALRTGWLVSVWLVLLALGGLGAYSTNGILSMLWSRFLAHLMLMAHLTGNQLDGLYCKLINWVYVKGQLKLNGLKEMKNLGYTVACKDHVICV